MTAMDADAKVRWQRVWEQVLFLPGKNKVSAEQRVRVADVDEAVEDNGGTPEADNKRLTQSAGQKKDEQKYFRPQQMMFEVAVAVLKILARAWHEDPRDTVVVDNFQGTGTTGLAARSLGLRYVGSDVDPRCRDVAVSQLKRLNEGQFEEGKMVMQMEGEDATFSLEDPHHSGYTPKKNSTKKPVAASPSSSSSSMTSASSSSLGSSSSSSGTVPPPVRPTKGHKRPRLPSLKEMTASRVASLDQEREEEEDEGDMEEEQPVPETPRTAKHTRNPIQVIGEEEAQSLRAPAKKATHKRKQPEPMDEEEEMVDITTLQVPVSATKKPKGKKKSSEVEDDEDFEQPSQTSTKKKAGK